jgi:hypothetical protein
VKKESETGHSTGNITWHEPYTTPCRRTHRATGAEKLHALDFVLISIIAGKPDLFVYLKPAKVLAYAGRLSVHNNNDWVLDRTKKPVVRSHAKTFPWLSNPAKAAQSISKQVPPPACDGRAHAAGSLAMPQRVQRVGWYVLYPCGLTTTLVAQWKEVEVGEVAAQLSGPAEGMGHSIFLFCLHVHRQHDKQQWMNAKPLATDRGKGPDFSPVIESSAHARTCGWCRSEAQPNGFPLVLRDHTRGDSTAGNGDIHTVPNCCLALKTMTTTLV